MTVITRSNTESLEHPESHHIEIYAREEIPAGTQLTTSYVSSALERNQRRQQLHDVWNFWCRCATCRDNTEGGTFRQTSSLHRSERARDHIIYNNLLMMMMMMMMMMW